MTEAHPATEAPDGGYSLDEAAAMLSGLPRIAPEDDDTGSDADDPELNVEAEGEEPDANAVDPDAEAEPETPAIAPPVSWKAEDKALFATLPPDAQKVIAARESERDKAIQSKATEAAEARRQAQQAEAAISHLNKTYAANLQQFLSADMPVMPDEALLESDPVAYLRQERAYNVANAQRAEAQQHIQAATQWQAQQEAAAREADMAEQHRILAERIPEWSDKVARAKIVDDITSLATAHGYDAERLAAADASDVIFLKQAAEWKAKAERLDVINSERMSVVRAAKELPKVARPGVSSSKGDETSRSFTQHRDNLRRSGSVHDAAAALSKLFR